jgi:hypothetical protein
LSGQSSSLDHRITLAHIRKVARVFDAPSTMERPFGDER